MRRSTYKMTIMKRLEEYSRTASLIQITNRSIIKARTSKALHSGLSNKYLYNHISFCVTSTGRKYAFG